MLFSWMVYLVCNKIANKNLETIIHEASNSNHIKVCVHNDIDSSMIYYEDKCSNCMNVENKMACYDKG